MADKTPSLPPGCESDAERLAKAAGTAVGSLVVAFALMFLLHRGVALMGRDVRPAAFLGFALLYLLWPLFSLMPPRSYLFGMVAFPLFGIWPGMTSTVDMGAGSYMFAAQPPCFGGLIGVVGTAWVAIHRAVKGW
ncbi:hypothetical protein [Rhodopirellula bahusiensis]|uniref:hypothetical protein n=1 Tax=Rhodopirellula bahusiensis TaxID=2014065 RepID=UPI003296BE53